MLLAHLCSVEILHHLTLSCFIKASNLSFIKFLCIYLSTYGFCAVVAMITQQSSGAEIDQETLLVIVNLILVRIKVAHTLPSHINTTV